jgi:threonine dehydratase
VRNNLSVVTALSDAQRRRGLIAATRGNHGQGLAWAGRLVGAPVTICVPFPALKAGLAGFVTASEAELAEAVRCLLRTTHHLAEGAGAAGLAGLVKPRDRLAGKRSGSFCRAATSTRTPCAES